MRKHDGKTAPEEKRENDSGSIPSQNNRTQQSRGTATDERSLKRVCRHDGRTVDDEKKQELTTTPQAQQTLTQGQETQQGRQDRQDQLSRQVLDLIAQGHFSTVRGNVVDHSAQPVAAHSAEQKEDGNAFRLRLQPCLNPIPNCFLPIALILAKFENQYRQTQKILFGTQYQHQTTELPNKDKRILKKNLAYQVLCELRDNPNIKAYMIGRPQAKPICPANGIKKSIVSNCQFVILAYNNGGNVAYAMLDLGSLYQTVIRTNENTCSYQLQKENTLGIFLVGSHMSISNITTGERDPHNDFVFELPETFLSSISLLVQRSSSSKEANFELSYLLVDAIRKANKVILQKLTTDSMASKIEPNIRNRLTKDLIDIGNETTADLEQLARERSRAPASGKGWQPSSFRP